MECSTRATRHASPRRSRFAPGRPPPRVTRFWCLRRTAIRGSSSRTASSSPTRVRTVLGLFRPVPVFGIVSSRAGGDNFCACRRCTRRCHLCRQQPPHDRALGLPRQLSAARGRRDRARGQLGARALRVEFRSQLCQRRRRERYLPQYIIYRWLRLQARRGALLSHA